MTMKTIPNILSAFRICLVPVFIIVYFQSSRNAVLYAALIYAIASVTDFFDGYLARKYNASSKLGLVLDPLGDKLMIIAVMVCITIDRIIPLWAVLVAFTKELLMAIGGIVIHKIARAEILPSNIIGKTSTATFFVISLVLMLFRGIPRGVATALISLAIVLMLFAFVVYLREYIKLMKSKDDMQPEKVGNDT